MFLYNTQFLNNIEIGLIALGLSAVEVYILFADKIRNKSNEVISGWGNFHTLNCELILLNALIFGFSCIEINYLPIYLGGLALLTFWIFQKIEKFKRYNIYSFVLLIGTISLSIYQAIYDADIDNKIILYSIQTLCVLLSVVYYCLQVKSTREAGKMFISVLPIVQNLWIIALLFIQVEIAYLAPIFMLLAILNFGLILYKKVNLAPESVLIIALLPILVSAFYSIIVIRCCFYYNNFSII